MHPIENKWTMGGCQASAIKPKWLSVSKLYYRHVTWYAWRKSTKVLICKWKAWGIVARRHLICTNKTTINELKFAEMSPYFVSLYLLRRQNFIANNPVTRLKWSPPTIVIIIIVLLSPITEIVLHYLLLLLSFLWGRAVRLFFLLSPIIALYLFIELFGFVDDCVKDNKRFF